jgi:hypothetical protein
MKLLLKRKFKGETYTIGDLFIDGKFFCNTIEDRVRLLPKICPDTPKGVSCKCREKVYAQTAIPSGEYKVTMEISPKFGRVLPRLHNVPHFIGILIHSGNTEGDSAGCIIVGNNAICRSCGLHLRFFPAIDKKRSGRH